MVSLFEAWARKYYLRPTFVFREPALFAQYAVVGVLLFLYCEKKKRRAILGATFCSLAILLSTSASGILVMILGWGVWMGRLLKSAIMRGRLRKSIFWATLLLILAVFGILLFTDVGSMLLSRIQEIGMDKGSTSGNQRVLKGFLVYFKLNIWRKFVGLGLGNIAGYFEKMQVQIPYDVGGNPEYMNSLTYILNSTGLCGTVLMLVVLVRRMFHSGSLEAALSWVILALAFGASIFNSGSWLIYMAFLLYNKTGLNEVISVKYMALGGEKENRL